MGRLHDALRRSEKARIASAADTWDGRSTAELAARADVSEAAVKLWLFEEGWYDYKTLEEWNAGGQVRADRD